MASNLQSSPFTFPMTSVRRKLYPTAMQPRTQGSLSPHLTVQAAVSTQEGQATGTSFPPQIHVSETLKWLRGLGLSSSTSPNS